MRFHSGNFERAVYADAQSRYMSVYTVGFYSHLKHAWHSRRYRPYLKRMSSYVWYQFKRRNWRAIRNYFNGYLAEPTPFPLGLHKCGRGWTKKAALRSLNRRARKAGVEAWWLV